jgi:RHH-type proline utilization regulon transcriptional repressor/proline dehydrogenase/delta 1-pyrroline-5-carboxylate dehydrogenase
MLGEAARTMADARAYAESYGAAIDAVAADAEGGPPEAGSGVSVKLSALHPHYEARNEARVFAELYPALLDLARRAKAGAIHLTLDAEEADRLVLSLKILDRLCAEPALEGWTGLGLAVQAYQKRARGVIADLADLARRTRRRLMVRLVKGAYWDGEIKRAQQQGRPDFPVFTTKPAADLSYLVCARDLIAAAPALFPQFATHNAHTAIAVRRMAEAAGLSAYEFQRLHGMGEALYAALGSSAPVRVYAPVGGHEELLPYLVRRLLENGANTSFVHTFLDDDVSPDVVAADPIARVEAAPRRHPRLPAPPALYGASRRNAAGRDLSVRADRAALVAAVASLDGDLLDAAPLIEGRDGEKGGGRDVRAPADRKRLLGRVRRGGAARLGQEGRRRPRGDPARDGRRAGAKRRSLRSAPGARGGAYAAGQRRRGARSDRLLPLLRSGSRTAVRTAASAAGARRRAQYAGAARARGLCVHQSVEFSAGDLHRTDRRGAGGWEHRRRQAGRTDPAHRLRGGAALL